MCKNKAFILWILNALLITTLAGPAIADICDDGYDAWGQGKGCGYFPSNYKNTNFQDMCSQQGGFIAYCNCSQDPSCTDSMIRKK